MPTDTPADPRLEAGEPPAHPPHRAVPAERVGGARVPPHAAADVAPADLPPAIAPTAHPAGALVGGVGPAFDAAPATAKAALTGHDAEVKASHGAGRSHDPTHSKAGGRKGIDPGMSGNNGAMDSRRAHYGVPQGRRTDGGR